MLPWYKIRMTDSSFCSLKLLIEMMENIVSLEKSNHRNSIKRELDMAVMDPYPGKTPNYPL